MNDTPFGDGTDRDNVAIDLSGDSLQVESGRDTNDRAKPAHDLFDDLQEIATTSNQKRKGILKKDPEKHHTVAETNWTDFNR